MLIYTNLILSRAKKLRPQSSKKPSTYVVVLFFNLLFCKITAYCEDEKINTKICAVCLHKYKVLIFLEKGKNDVIYALIDD